MAAFRRGTRRPPDAAQAVDPESVRAAAITLLARRDYSVAALRERLVGRGFEPDAVTEGLQGLIDEKLLDDERYAFAFVRSHAGRGQGPRRLRQDLAETGLPAALIDQALAEGPDFHQLATELRRRRFGDAPPTDWAERARQARFLQYRGFSTDHIRSALGSSGADDLPDDADP